ncbi:magnesium transporter [Candidatus Magnetominusculus xianensis]|uniref:Magnesium transporter MgtE n=1 Tax=Candidatus Magnetominusculus xianensis TaxID=1748249 RepID=A0ABR5SEM1_9BACT|nr:CBS domain-containing protein [Candidatus Magnetominusculus xianensis]KWT84935.1 magnesium transporter MgtE [Candidatus Magnetominusculus xianensis]MBF0404483.1 magnesium transporter [Nitrospirota bacterium]
MPLVGEIFLSEILKKPVFDQKGEDLGRIRDVVVVKGISLPDLESIIIERKKTYYCLDYKSLTVFNKRIITTTQTKDNLPHYERYEQDLLAVRDILDKQVVDINGAKVVRVNDIKIEGYNGNAVFVAIDIGMRGILRRFGIEKKGEKFLRLFRIPLPYNLIRWDYLQPLSPRLTSISLTMPQQMLSKMHPADLAEIINSVSREEGASFFHRLDVESAAETLTELQPETQLEILASMDTEKAADIIEEMSPDDAADILSDLPANRTQEILGTIEPEDADNIAELLCHEQDTAGGLMNIEYLLYPESATIAETIGYFREDSKDIDTVYHIYVSGEQDRLVGVITLKDLFLNDPELKLSDIMETNIKSLRPEDDEDVVAAMVSKYNLVAIPVVNDEQRMMGLITVDDIIDQMLPPSAKRKRKKI